MDKPTHPFILADNLYIPDKFLSEKELEKWHYVWKERVVTERKDEYGEVVVDARGKPRFDINYETRTLDTFRRITTHGKTFIALPKGNAPKLTHLLKKYRVQDLRPIAPLPAQVHLKHKVVKDSRWKNGQRQCVWKFFKKGYGIIIGDPGSGKTVIGAGIVCGLNLRTLILTKRRDGNKHWIKQLRKLTNVTDVELATQQTLLGAYSSKIGRVYPITVATVQAFLSKKGREDLIKFQNYFSFLLGDEVHELITPKYKLIPLTFNTLAVAGLTATETRDDMLHYLEFDIFGPVIAENKTEKDPPTVTFIYTGVHAPMWIYSKPYNIGWKWNMCIRALETSTSRYDLITKWVYKDIDAGKRVACISPQRRSIVKELERRFRQDGYKVAYVDGTTKNRQQIYDDVNAGKYDVLCAGKVLNALVDIQALNCVHLVSPLKKHASTIQLYGRAREKNALIRDYVDEGGQLTGAFKSRLAMCEGFGWKIVHSKTGTATPVAITEPLSSWKPPKGK